jgi:hypothetical protein
MKQVSAEDCVERTIVTFKTKMFNTSQSKDYFINECCFGDDLCHWLRVEFQKRGATCDDEPGQEDFGWYLNFVLGEDKYCLVGAFRADSEEPESSSSLVGAASSKQVDDGVARDGDSGDDDGLWVLFLERSLGFWASVFGGRDKGLKMRGAKMLHETLMAEKAISEVKWHRKKDFDQGKEELALDVPA